VIERPNLDGATMSLASARIEITGEPHSLQKMRSRGLAAVVADRAQRLERRAIDLSTYSGSPSVGDGAAEAMAGDRLRHAAKRRR